MGAKDLKSLLELLLKDSHIVHWHSQDERNLCGENDFFGGLISVLIAN